MSFHVRCYLVSDHACPFCMCECTPWHWAAANTVHSLCASFGSSRCPSSSGFSQNVAAAVCNGATAVGGGASGSNPDVFGSKYRVSTPHKKTDWKYKYREDRVEVPSCIVLVIHLMAVLVEFGVKQLHRLFKRLHLLFHRGIRFQVVFGPKSLVCHQQKECL